nr:peptidoglycan DD-metalloendopeptidase family protein [bacterium]
MSKNPFSNLFSKKEGRRDWSTVLSLSVGFLLVAGAAVLAAWPQKSPEPGTTPPTNVVTPSNTRGPVAVVTPPDDTKAVAGTIFSRTTPTPGHTATPAPTPIQTPDTPQAPHATPKVLKELQLPSQGAAGMRFSQDALVFSTTLKQWMTHNGLDLCCTEGTPVAAAADGTVVSVKNDALMGMTVTIEHTDSVKTIYSSLQETVKVKAGDQLKKGDIIGAVGTTAISECEEGAHLHFEVWINDKPIDPACYLELPKGE